MEGNFRIVQYDENTYGIEKEFETSQSYPWWKFKRPTKEYSWHRVDIKGEFSSVFNKEYETSDLEVAKERLKRIKEYPKLVD